MFIYFFWIGVQKTLCPLLFTENTTSLLHFAKPVKPSEQHQVIRNFSQQLCLHIAWTSHCPRDDRHFVQDNDTCVCSPHLVCLPILGVVATDDAAEQPPQQTVNCCCLLLFTVFCWHHRQKMRVKFSARRFILNLWYDNAAYQIGEE